MSAPMDREGEHSSVSALVIDDDPLIASLLCEMLIRLGVEADRCLDPDEGVEKAVSGSYSFVSTDMAMPTLHGREVVRRIRAGRPDLPVFVISGYLDEELIAELRGLGIAGIVHKPFTFRDIQRQISRASEIRG